MFANPITGRAFIFTGYPPSEEEFTTPDPSLTIAIISFCIVGPFWLTHKLIKRLTKKSDSVTDRSLQVIE